MENLVNFYKGKRVLVTGHCGFKGSWLVAWLKKMGAEVEGIGHYPHTIPNHYELLGNKIYRGTCCVPDLLSRGYVEHVFKEFNPEIVFHLAAKAIVARTFEEPRETFENNVMGAVNLLEACRQVDYVKAIVMITTDKVYQNKEWQWGYRENDELGDTTPYGASKVCVEQVINSYRKHFLPCIATARAGNVIGGGDWSYKRLIPDIVRATAEGKPVEVHTPNATRPWQHVLEPLAGYLLLAKALYQMNYQVYPYNPNPINKAWNFGPEGEMTVLDVLKIAKETWPKIEYVVKEEETHPSMTQLLKIDSTEAHKKLGWKPQWTMEQAIRRTIEWYKAYYEEGFVKTQHDIEDYR